MGTGDEDEVLGRDSIGWREETQGSSSKDNSPSQSSSQTEVLGKGSSAASLEEWQHDSAGDSAGQHLLPGTHDHAGSQAQQLRGQNADWTESGSSSMQPEGSQPRLDHTILFLGSKAQIFPSIGADPAAMLAADMGNPTPSPFGAKVPAAAVEALPTSGGLSSSAPLLAATDLQLQAPMPSGPVHGSHPHHIKLETGPVSAEEQSRPMDPAIPAPGPMTPQVDFFLPCICSNGLVMHHMPACLSKLASASVAETSQSSCLFAFASKIFATTFLAKCRSWQFSCPQCLSGAHKQAHICEHAELVTVQEVIPSERPLPSNSLATDLQKGQFFPMKGQPAPVSITQELESTGDIVDDVHALEEHARAVASTAEVSLDASCGASLHDGWPSLLMKQPCSASADESLAHANLTSEL